MSLISRKSDFCEVRQINDLDQHSPEAHVDKTAALKRPDFGVPAALKRALFYTLLPRILRRVHHEIMYLSAVVTKSAPAPVDNNLTTC